MNKNNVKELLGKEGLIIVLILLFFLAINIPFGMAYRYFHTSNQADMLPLIRVWHSIQTFLLLYLYPLYALIRFIIWRLKRKEGGRGQ